jgi:LPS O-antigen subunit length determinant protein (WzzB/FepE family)
MSEPFKYTGYPGGEPQGFFVVVPPAVEEDHFEFRRVVAAVLGSWKAALIGSIVGGCVAAVIAVQMTPIYRAQAMISPMESGAGVASSLRSQFGGLASLAGVDIGADASRKVESFATLSSQGFARRFIETNNLMPQLFPERWDNTRQGWRDKAPTLEDGVLLFTRQVRSVVEDRKSGLITVTIEFRSPTLAADWANLMVEQVNDQLRLQAAREAQNSIQYLNAELGKTNVIELRQAIFRLIEAQVHNAMLANVQREFAFRFIERAVPPERRFSPRRTILTVIGALAGAGFAISILWVWRAYRRERARNSASV